jgi:hypothetical protein
MSGLAAGWQAIKRSDAGLEPDRLPRIVLKQSFYLACEASAQTAGWSGGAF